MSFFRKLFGKKFKDEPLEDQRKEVEKEHQFAFPGKVSNIKEGCDQIPDAVGEFGLDSRNPIPVNGVGGELKYLNRLLCPCGAKLIFHRLGCNKSNTTGDYYDMYEAVCINGKHWSTFYLDMHYSRRSMLLPAGYSFCDFHPLFSKFTLGFGANGYCDNFPMRMPEIIESRWGGVLGRRIAEQLRDILGDGTKFRKKI